MTETPDAVRLAAETRAILAAAGRPDLADAAWRALCPLSVPDDQRIAALYAAGYRPAPRADQAGRAAGADLAPLTGQGRPASPDNGLVECIVSNRLNM